MAVLRVLDSYIIEADPLTSGLVHRAFELVLCELEQERVISDTFEKNQKQMTLESVYNRVKKQYEGHPSWMWEDEGKWNAVAEYYSHMGEFTHDDLVFARNEDIMHEVRDVIDFHDEINEEERSQNGENGEGRKEEA